VVIAVALVTLGTGQQDGRVRIVGGTSDQHEMADWAIGRFEAVGFTLPPLEIRFEGRGACKGHLGLYDDGVVRECRIHTDLWASRELLHEMAHAWLDANLTAAQRERFLELRGLTTWSNPSVLWEERGYEQAAEIIAWAIGDQGQGIYMPSIPNNGLRQLADAYGQLTNNPLPKLAPWMLWRERG
jgi:hypothetical protein